MNKMYDYTYSVLRIIIFFILLNVIILHEYSWKGHIQD